MENDLVLPDLPPLLLLEMEKRSELHCRQYTDPPTDLLEFLRQYGLTTLQVLGPMVRQVEDCRDTARLAQHVSTLAGAAWHWCRAIHAAIVAAPLLLQQTTVVKQLRAVSWYLFTQAALLKHVLRSSLADGQMYDRTPDVLLTHAHTFAVVRILAEGGRRDVAVAPDRVMLARYSVRQWEAAVRLFLEEQASTLGWTPSGGAYFGALLLRYAMLVQASTRRAAHPEDETAYDHPMYCRRAGDSPFAGARLTSDFLGDWALRLIPALSHQMAAQRWASEGRYNMQHALRVYLPPRAASINAWAQFATDVGTDGLMREAVLNRIQKVLLQRLVAPGELAFVAQKERLPVNQIDADHALTVLRPKTYAAARVLLKLDLPALVTGWVKAARATPEAAAALPLSDDTGWELVAVARPPYEVVALLVMETCLDVYDEATTGGACALQKSMFIDDATCDEAPGSPGDAVVSKDFYNQGPLLVAVNRVYSVVVPSPAEEEGVRTTTFASPCLVDALTLWLQERVLHGRLQRRDVHPALHPLLLPRPVEEDV